MKRYVVGDIHGCHDELAELLDRIDEHANEDYRIIFVGDYIDRGPKSKEVVKKIQRMEKQGHIALKGNHEDMLSMDEKTFAKQTLDSFGGKIPKSVLKWAESLPKYYEDDTIIVAHAGAKPEIPMNEQTDAMLMYYRYEQRGLAYMGKHFYHGHTPNTTFIDNRSDRTNVDTGCVYGGPLTAAVVGKDGKPEDFIQVKLKLDN